MEATITTKSSYMFTVDVTELVMNSDNAFPCEGIIEVGDDLAGQLALEAKSLGSWQAAQETELFVTANNKSYELEIKIKDAPITGPVRFITTKLLEPTR